MSGGGVSGDDVSGGGGSGGGVSGGGDLKWNCNLLSVEGVDVWQGGEDTENLTLQANW